MDDNRMEGAVLARAEKVVPTEERQCVGRTRPGVDQEEQKVLEIVSPNAVVHPRTVVVHPADTSVADPAVMRHGWFEGLALAAHGVRIFHEPLAFARNGSEWYAAWIGETGLSMAGQCHETQDVVYHATGDGDALRDCQ
mmetsp:Transcript_18284/g.42085  ORF Transcript_18284/g.42085 Transcript_18284/m.42085 type:complete len:139 (+) Transcript_18284:738-1154(+)